MKNLVPQPPYLDLSDLSGMTANRPSTHQGRVVGALVLHPVTRQQLERFAADPAHALIIAGPTGSGKLQTAQAVAESILELTNSITGYPYALKIAVEADKKLIAIEAIRQLEQFLSRKVPSSAAYNRVAIIEDAHLLSLPAQNALLKTLEEPPQGTIIILTTINEQALLPTVRSRAQSIKLTNPDQATLMDHFACYDKLAFKRAYAVSGGLVGLMSAILQSEDHPLTQATDYARQLLSQSAYHRLLLVDTLAKDRALATNTVLILQQMAQLSLQTAQGTAAAKWQNVLQTSYQAAESLAHNGNTKLTLSSLMLNL